MKKNFVSKKINKNPNGFSMMEVVMSVFLISTGLIAAVQLISSGLTTSMDSRDQLIATELTQEGLELVRNIRDTNWVNSRASFDYIITDDDCIIDKNYLSGEISCGKTPGEKRLYLNGNFYTHTPSATATKFYRNIKVEIDGNDRIVTSMVSWKGQSPVVGECTLKNKCFYAQTKLTTWGQP